MSGKLLYRAIGSIIYREQFFKRRLLYYSDRPSGGLIDDKKLGSLAAEGG